MTLEVEVKKKGVIIIPKAVRDLLGIKEGSKLKLEVKGGKIILEPEKKIDVGEVERNLEEHWKRISYAKKPKLGELANVHLEEEFEDDISGRGFSDLS